jgi:hypothetical protein
VNTNWLLIIIIILLTLGLLVQFFQLILIFLFPEQLLRLFVDSTEALLDSDEEAEVDVIDVDVSDQSEPTKSKGFGQAKKSKFSRRKWSSKLNKNSTETSESQS